MIAFGAVGCAIYGAGIPFFFSFILRHGEKTGLKSDPQYLRRYGFLYIDFRQHAYQWEVVILIRRFTLVVIMVVSNNVYAQALFAILAIAVCLLLQMYYVPYLESRINVLEVVALSSLLFYVLCGLLFTSMVRFFPSYFYILSLFWRRTTNSQ